MEELIEQWLEVKKDLAQAKSEEIELRNEIIESLNFSFKEGTSKVNDFGFKITIGQPLSRLIDEAELNQIYSNLTDQEKECIKYKPSLKLKEYKELTKDNSDLKLDKAITEKPGQATLKIEFEDE